MKIAITGTIGGGKSSASCYLKSLGYPVYDADKLVHDFYLKDGILYDAVINLFGVDILDENLEIKRQDIARRVFNDQRCLKELESLVFPAVLAKIQTLYEDHDGLVFFEVPLLFESNMEANFDCIICISAPIELRLERLKARGMDPDEAMARMKRHTLEAIKKDKSDFFINNDGLVLTLNDKIDTILTLIKKGGPDEPLLD